MNEKEGVSIVICCYNSSQRITKTLEYLQKIKTEIPWEVIIVDNCSNDDTSEKSLMIWNKNPVTRMKVVKEEIPGLMHARHKGAETAVYNIISFIDDDNWIESKWVDKVFTIMRENQTVAACGGKSEGVFESAPPSWFNDFAMSYAVGKQQNKSGFVMPEKGYLWGAGLTVRRQAWEDLFNSGFTSLLKGRKGKSLTAGEDSELCFAWMLQGWKLWYDDSLTLMHFITTSRLNMAYLEKMVKGFGMAEVILSLYRGALSDRYANKSTWSIQFLASIKKMWLSQLKSIFSSGRNRIKNSLTWKHDRAYVRELLFNRENYNLARQQIKNIKKSSGKIPGQTQL